MQWMAFCILVLCFGLSSCNPVEVEADETGTSPQIGDEVWESRALTSDEIQTARKFCRALESKEIAYRRDYVGQKLTFNLQYRNCDGKNSAASLQATLIENMSDRHLEFLPSFSPLPFWREVQVIGGQVMGEFCVDLLSNLQVSNTILEGSRKSVYQFTMTASGDFKVQVQRFSQESDSVNTIEQLIAVGVGSGSRPRGMVTDRLFIQACDDSSDNSTSYFRRQSL